MKKITLADIAKKTGYSVNTVSHALRDMKDISVPVKRYINDTAQEMGYIPNASAGVLRSGRTMNIAVIASDIADPYSAGIIKAAEQQLRRYGYTCFIIGTEGSKKEEEKAVRTAISKNADGIIIVFPTDKTEESLKPIKENSIPCVQILHRKKKTDIPCVISDRTEEGYIVTDKLISLGHREVLYLGNSGTDDVLKGVEKVYKENSLSEDALHTYPVKDRESIEEILNENTSCSAVICSSDMLAAKVCRILIKQGKSIPEDMSVIGIGALSEEYIYPFSITSAGCSKTGLATEAIQMLFDIINGKSEKMQLIIPVSLFSGETVKEPARKYKAPSKKALSDYLL